MPELHSSVVGGSSAARVINCLGSKELLAQLPVIINRDSVYSIEGTALHTATEMLINKKTTLAKLKGKVIQTRSGPVIITETLVHDALTPAMDYWKKFLTEVDTFQLEAQVQFPGIEGAFGTADVLGRNNKLNITRLTDWKFGAGKGVLALYPDPSDLAFDIVNEQLMFYATAARYTHPKMFPPGCKIQLDIVQPRARGQEPITSATVTLEDLDAFAEELKLAVGTHGPVKKGHWCEFQPCRSICPEHTGALFNLEELSMKVPAMIGKDVTAHTISLLDILDAAPAVEALIKEARAQAHILLGNGEKLEGWKLVAKRGTRQWAVPEEKLPKLLKLPKKDLYETTLKSPAQVEKLLPKKTKLPDGVATTVSSGTTIAREDDKRPAITGDPNEMSKILLEVLGDDE